jgi:hypothetical protein
VLFYGSTHARELHVRSDLLELRSMECLIVQSSPMLNGLLLQTVLITCTIAPVSIQTLSPEVWGSRYFEHGLAHPKILSNARIFTGASVSLPEQAGMLTWSFQQANLFDASLMHYSIQKQ